MNLYRVCVKVRPSKDHPKFWDLQFGYLMIWIYAVHRDDAGAKAVEIVEQLPYEKFKVGHAWEETWRVTVHSTEYESPLPEFRECKQRALQVGLAIFFHACETGADEADFEKQNCF